jgi:F-type H+-transporting ATPase subunit c
MTLVKKIGLCLVALMILGAMATPAPAQDKDLEKAKIVAEGHRAPFGGPGIGAGIGAGLVICGASYGFGRIGGSALESMARQPETAGRVQTAMIIIGALLEGATFFALIICIQLAGKA